MAEHRRRIGVYLAAIWLAAVVFAAIAGPWLPLQDPSAQGECTTKQPTEQLDEFDEPVVVDGRFVRVEQPGCSFQRAANDRPGAYPSPDHLLGNDQIGRDLLSRLVAGARTTVVVAFGSVAAAIVAGGLLGALSAYVGGRIDTLVSSIAAGLLAVPALVVTIALIAALGRSSFTIWLALTVAATPVIALVTRSQAASLVTREYVTAARMLGATHRRILLREVVPNLAPFVLVFFGLGVAAAIGAEGGLALIGLSVDNPQTSWGAIIGDGKTLIESRPHISLIPSAVMFLTIWSTTRLTDELSARLGVRQSLL